MTRPVPSVTDGTAAVVICNWRDLRHPEGGGSERYVETVAQHLSARGNEVTLLCARVDGEPADEVRDGVRYLRVGGRLGVYPGAARALLRRDVRADVVLDVQNGMPFWSPLVTRRPVAVLLHHVHREQWPIVFGRMTGRLGWWLESRVAPRLYRRSRYVTVSECTRAELAEQGIDAGRVTIAHNGTPSAPPSTVGKSATPRLVVLGRLVPHKRVEIAVRAAVALRAQFPDLLLDVVGQGYWAEQLHRLVDELGAGDIVRFHGFVDESAKADLLTSAWVNLVPSVKEGWGLSVVEAASHGTPSLAFADAGGLSESIADGRTGLLVDGDEERFVRTLALLLQDAGLQAELGANARRHAAGFGWDSTARIVADVLDAALGHDRPVTDSPDTVTDRPVTDRPDTDRPDTDRPAATRVRAAA